MSDWYEPTTLLTAVPEPVKWTAYPEPMLKSSHL